MKLKRSKITGILFIVCTVSGIASVSIMGTPATQADLSTVLKNDILYKVGAIFQMLMALTCAGIAISIYPVIRQQSPGLAIGAVGFRLIEGAVFTLSSCLTMVMLSLYQSGSLNDYTSEIIMTTKYWTSTYGAAISFCLGAAFYYIAFIKSRQIPRWIAIWGLVAVVLHIIAVMFVASGMGPFSTAMLVLNVPIFLQEMVFALWLIVRGYKEEEGLI